MFFNDISLSRYDIRLCRMIYLRPQIWYNIRSFIREAYIICEADIIPAGYIIRDQRERISLKKATFVGRQMWLFSWCRWRGSNPHGIATTGFWVQHVCQFHHSGKYKIATDIFYHKRSAKSIGFVKKVRLTKRTHKNANSDSRKTNPLQNGYNRTQKSEFAFYQIQTFAYQKRI